MSPKVAVALRRAADWKPAFLTALGTTGNLRAALMQVNVERKTFKKALAHSPDFRALVALAMEDAIDIIEYRGIQRAVAGSDRMIEFFLKAHRPETYGDKAKVDITLMLRSMAEAEGIDPDEAEATALRLLG